MQIIPISQCSKELEFSRYRTWPDRLVAYAWRNYLLSHFSSNHESAICIGTEVDDLFNVLPELYPNLSLVESAFLKQKLEQLNIEALSELVKSAEISKLILLLPSRFQDWLHDKRASPKDLVVLRSVPELNSVFPILENIVAKNCSRQFGVQILEIACELFLMGKSLAEILPSEKDSAETWLVQLKKIRYPMSAETDFLNRNKLAALAWPLQVEIEWQRRGDQTGIQIKFFAQSQSDLEKKISGLEKTSSTIKSNPELLWKN